MLLNTIVWNLSLVLTLVFFFIAGIVFFYGAYAWSKSIDEYFDSPKFNMPDELTIEIVKKSPDLKEASQTSPSDEPSLTLEHLSSSSSNSKGKGVYVPE